MKRVITAGRELSAVDLMEGRPVVLRSPDGQYSLPMRVRRIEEEGVVFETIGVIYMVFFGRQRKDGTITDSSGVRLCIYDLPGC